jgi:hypothetical protein
MICCCCLWLVLLVTGNRSARIIEISRFFIFLYFIRLEKTFGFDFSGGGKEGRQEEENKVKSKTAGVLDHDNSIQRKREKRTREREIMPHWWTPCLEAYPIRMPERTPPRIRSEQSESAVEPQFVKAMPLREVVADCEKRWFEQTLKAAKNGDVAMQSLVGQMFCSGYGVTANLKKGKLWLQKAAESDMEARSLLASLSGLEKTRASNLHSSKQN